MNVVLTLFSVSNIQWSYYGLNVLGLICRIPNIFIRHANTYQHTEYHIMKLIRGHYSMDLFTSISILYKSIYTLLSKQFLGSLKNSQIELFTNLGKYHLDI